jgi:hypothetical protein
MRRTAALLAFAGLVCVVMASAAAVKYKNPQAPPLPSYGIISIPDLQTENEVPKRGDTVSLATAQDVARFRGHCESSYALGWSPVAEVRGGFAHVRHLRRLTEDRSVFGCKGGDCLTVVRLRLLGGLRAEDILGVCRVSKVGNTYGAPKNCDPLFTNDQNREFVRVKFRGHPGCAHALGLPDFDLVYWGGSIDRTEMNEKVTNETVATLSSNRRLRAVARGALICTARSQQRGPAGTNGRASYAASLEDMITPPS